MADQKKPKVKNINAMVSVHIMAICYAAYMFYLIVRDYVEGGEGAPSLATLIIGGIVLLGGGAFVALLTYRLYKNSKAPDDVPALEEENK